MSDDYKKYSGDKKSGISSASVAICLMLVIAVIVAFSEYGKHSPDTTSASNALADNNPTASVPASANSPVVQSDESASCCRDDATSEPVEEEVPEKTVPELLAEVDASVSSGEFQNAGDLMTEVLDRINKQALTSVPLWLKSADISLAVGEDGEAKSAYERALAIQEREYGPEDARLLSSVAGLVTALDAAGDIESSRVMLSRYLELVANVKASALPVVSSTADEARAKELASQAGKNVGKTENADGVEGDTDCGGMLTAISAATEKFGRRSAVRALLMLNLAQNNENAAAAVADECDVDAEDLTDTLSILEQHYGPFDKRLTMVLRRLTAASDDSGKYKLAEFFRWRLSLLGQTATARLPAPYVEGESLLSDQN